MFNDSTGYYELNGINDIAEEEMRRIYNIFHDYRIEDMAFRYAYQRNIRTNLTPKTGTYTNLYVPVSLYYAFYYSQGLEVLKICDNVNARDAFHLCANNCDNAFSNCGLLREIQGVINISAASNLYNMFFGCAALQEVRIMGLTANLSFSDSPLISRDSLLYLVQNSANTSPVTVTVHQDVYDKLTGTDAQWSEVLTEAATKQITFTTE